MTLNSTEAERLRVLQAKPERDRTEAEKQELAQLTAKQNQHP